MPTNRNITFRNGEIYHLFNRSIDRRHIFVDKKGLYRAKMLIKFYRHRNIPIRFSQVMQQSLEKRDEILTLLYQSQKLVDILSYCLMPNHFHFLLRQKSDKGIPIFISNFTNAYTKYFNTRNNRKGPIFEGIFKGVHVETDEQLIHISRYIHINPVTSSIIPEEQLSTYEWSSYPEYLSLSNDNIAQKDTVLTMFKDLNNYQSFITDQIEYGKTLESIKHLMME